MAAAAADEQERRPATKYVLITGGVVSGLGKGVTASSVGVVLKSCGLRVTCIKIGPLPLPLPLPLNVFSLPALRDSWLGSRAGVLEKRGEIGVGARGLSSSSGEHLAASFVFVHLEYQP
jgi:hypothetical protein